MSEPSDKFDEKDRVWGTVVVLFTFWALAAGLVLGGYFFSPPPVDPVVVEAPEKPSYHQKVTTEVARWSYVRVWGDNGQGSGTEGVYKGRVYVLTARHVVVDNGEIWVTGYASKGQVGRKASVIAEDKDSDLAVLWIQSPREGRYLPSLVPATDPQVYEDVWYTTNGGGLDGYSVKGQVSKTGHAPCCEMCMTCRTTLFTGQGTYGSSGGGIFVKRGDYLKLVGVCSHFSALDRAMRSPLASPEPNAIKKFLETYIP